MFEQILDPTGHVWLSVLISLVPLIALLFMLAALRMTAWLASILVGVITIPIGVYVWHAPLAGTLKSYLYGGLTGFWVIDWITFWGLIIFNTLVLTGNFERFKNWMIHHATADIRIQTIMLAWAFGALLEGLVGFGFPWAVVVPILVGLGIADLDAIRVAALANNAPVSYGALGAPILGLALVTGLATVRLVCFHREYRGDPRAAAPVGLDLPGKRMGRGGRGVASGDRRVAFLYPGAMAGGPLSGALYLPDLSGALVSFWVLFIFVKIWRPKTIRGFGGEPLASPLPRLPISVEMGSVREALYAWLPYIVLILVVVGWTNPKVAASGHKPVQMAVIGEIVGDAWHPSRRHLILLRSAAALRHWHPGS